MVPLGFILILHISISCCGMQILWLHFGIACQNIVHVLLQYPRLNIAFLPWGLTNKNFKRAENEFLAQGKTFDEKSRIANSFHGK